MPRRLTSGLCLLAACLCGLSGCGSSGSTPQPPSQSGLDAGQFAKTDIDRVAETHQREVFADLRMLAEKLYRRNPREWRKGSVSTVDAAVARLFTVEHAWNFTELNGRRGTQAIDLAFRDDYQGDRVLAFVVGLASMTQAAFHDKTQFFLLDDLDPQALYNAARNVEIAVWKLSNARNAHGDLYLLSNESAGTVANLSFEREFGKIIASLDILSAIAAEKNNRTVVKVVQSLATAVFLPIK
jgi:hypothetical protein